MRELYWTDYKLDLCIPRIVADFISQGISYKFEDLGYEGVLLLHRVRDVSRKYIKLAEVINQGMINKNKEVIYDIYEFVEIVYEWDYGYDLDKVTWNMKNTEVYYKGTGWGNTYKVVDEIVDNLMGIYDRTVCVYLIWAVFMCNILYDEGYKNPRQGTLYMILSIIEYILNSGCLELNYDINIKV